MSAFYHNIEVKDAGKKGKGLFATSQFNKNDVIVEFSGKLVRRDQLAYPYQKIPEVMNLLQIDKDLFLSMSGRPEDYTNHSCSPNAWLFIIGQRVFLKALYQINPGMEITFDYSTSSSDTYDDWNINCECGSFNCRKVISGFQYLDTATKNHYKALKIVPFYLLGL